MDSSPEYGAALGEEYEGYRQRMHLGRRFLGFSEHSTGHTSDNPRVQRTSYAEKGYSSHLYAD
jgi:hypothetical protein